MAATAKRRQFSSGDKRSILAAADRCPEVGEIGARLRREGLYLSQLAMWRKPRGGKADPYSSKPDCVGSWHRPDQH